MEYRWEFKISPSPPATRYNDLYGSRCEDGNDAWITEADLKTLTHIPGVPAEAYAVEERAGLILYIRGLPFGLKSKTVRDIFMPFGKVNKSPILISLKSQETFRWVIMKHADDAEDAKRALHGSTHESGNQLFVSTATKYGEVFELLGKKLPEGLRASKKIPLEIGHGHGHPFPPAVQPPKHQLPPIPRIVVPAIAPHVAPPVAPAGLRGASATFYPAASIPQQPVRLAVQQIPAAIPVAKIAASKENIKPSAPVPERTTAKPKASILESVTAQVTAQSSSWANIASSSNPATRIIELRPEHKTSNNAPRLHPVGRIPKVVNTREEPLADQLRLVFLLNLPNTIGLDEITQAIREGPLVRIRFGMDDDSNTRFAGIVFQHAEHAGDFHKVLMKERQKSRPERFRFIVDAVRGDACPADDTIKVMNGEPFATRRLTIVKGKFFFMFGERQLRDLCCKIAGEDHVQLVWLYNGGNATVVFSDVDSAIKVKAVLDKRANANEEGEKGPESIVWKGLLTTYSKDPCVHALDLKTAMHD